MSAHQEEEKTGIAFLDKIFFSPTTNRYGIISVLLIAVGCLGGVGVGTGGLDYTAELIVLVATTMMSLALILAVAPMKQIIFSSLLALVTSSVCIILNLAVL